MTVNNETLPVHSDLQICFTHFVPGSHKPGSENLLLLCNCFVFEASIVHQCQNRRLTSRGVQIRSKREESMPHFEGKQAHKIQSH